ncbi:RICIN domain-containing protein [Actinoallomurus purpureus]|uniref:RICIN domain-containing protein n=1 Tax=Actinoallomurus purpureus TaxID=478114 RepID=UPI00209229E1|nr:RICIN domain-containing protein [Actinoallomurus purpureus]MCO6008072.1 RICIN domain-containing protein [Actinoallomurus purpureus]
MHSTARKLLNAFVVMVTTISLLALAPQAYAYGPSVLYQPPPGAQEYGALYPKTAQLHHNGAKNGALLTTFEQPATTPVFPIYRSTDNGATWGQISSIADTVNGWGNRNGAFLYELPQQIGNLPAGTILCVGLSAPPDKSAERMEVYKSNDAGQTWSWVSEIAQAGGYTTTPIWEPFVMVENNKLIVYYSDERDKAHNNQKIVHQTSADGVHWGPVVNDVAPTDSNLRPGMPVVSKLADGKYFMSYEVVNLGSGPPNNFKISNDPESWNATDLGTQLDTGGSPYNIVLPDGKLVYDSYGSSDVLINTNNGVGSWTHVKVPIEAGYSRTLQYVSGTGRVLIMSCGGFWQGKINTIRYADVDLGHSTGAYYKFVNRKSGKVIGVLGGDLADGADLVQWTDTGAADQAWHMTTTSGGTTVLGNRGSGRVIGVYASGTADGDDAVQWLDTGAADQQWQVVQVGSYVKLRNVHSGKVLGVLGGSNADGAQLVQWTDNGSLDQQWQIVQVS